MKIATCNVNGINGRLAVLVRWLREDSPDVVCLQELKLPNERFPRAELERAGELVAGGIDELRQERAGLLKDTSNPCKQPL